ncbi:MAG: hypothetical protein ACP5N2_01405 [Candidatus Nanoarchaeia archaeon]
MEEKKQEKEEITLQTIYTRVTASMWQTTLAVLILQATMAYDSRERDKRFDSIDSRLKRDLINYVGRFKKIDFSLKLVSSGISVLPKTRYINDDSLIDLDYGAGKIYLQTIDGKFVEYNQKMVDSIYYAKQESIKLDYENKMKAEITKIQKEKEESLKKIKKD